MSKSKMITPRDKKKLKKTKKSQKTEIQKIQSKRVIADQITHVPSLKKFIENIFYNATTRTKKKSNTL